MIHNLERRIINLIVAEGSLDVARGAVAIRWHCLMGALAEDMGVSIADLAQRCGLSMQSYYAVAEGNREADAVEIEALKTAYLAFIDEQRAESEREARTEDER